MKIVLSVLPLIVLTGFAGDNQKAASPDELAKKPITTAGGKVGELLKQWWKDGTAAGNVGDFYDNRDGSHSDLNMAPYPQLQKIHYTPEDIKIRRHWAAQRVIVPNVTFGNSSTSAPPTTGGSNIRSYYVSPKGIEFLYQQYTKNNLYIYPEHRDHDPGHNGRGDGFGDLYPANTPYLIASQGSSGSDQTFMRAIPFTLAGFRPDVKKKLTEAGLLMPTLQMIWRSTNKHLKAPDEYLTGKAHPTVFEGSWVDDLKMVQMAHDMKVDAVPPMVQLKVVEEGQPVLGKDFFDGAGASEKLADTPCAIARIFRGKDLKRRLVVSAEDSYDLNKRPLTFTWVVLRGDPTRIVIKPLNDAKSRAEISVSHHERRPISPGSTLESNRVDIGVFVHNGVHHSAPAFITYYSLDSESRAYDDKGRIVEIGYGMGETNFAVADWQALLELAGKDSLVGRLLGIPQDMHERVARAATEHKTLHAALMAAREKQKLAKEAADVQAAQKAVAAATKAVNDLLDRKDTGQAKSLRVLFEGALQQSLRHPVLSPRPDGVVLEALKKTDKARQNAVFAEQKRLALLGISISLEAAAEPQAKMNWTPFERAQRDNFNAVVLASVVYPGIVTSSYQRNFVDFRLSVPKNWRDVYRYDAEGQYLGWTRHGPDGKAGFSPEGYLIVEKDKLGRCFKGKAVRYEAGPLDKSAVWPPLRQVIGDDIVEFRYDSDQDWRGRIKK